MHSNVYNIITSRSKPFATKLAPKRFLTSMNPEVIAQAMTLLEFLRTFRTCERPLIGMYAKMLLQIAFTRKTLVTKTADEGVRGM